MQEPTHYKKCKPENEGLERLQILVAFYQSARRRRTTTLGTLAHFGHFRHLTVCQGTFGLI